MNIPSAIRNARLYARAEGVVARIRLRLLGRQLALGAIATGLLLLGLAFVNLGLFRALEAAWGPVWTPLGLGLGNIGLALAVLAVAALLGPGPDLAMAEELRGLAAEAIEADLAAPGGLMRSAEGEAARLLVPVIATILGAMRRRKPKAEG